MLSCCSCLRCSADVEAVKLYATSRGELLRCSFPSAASLYFYFFRLILCLLTPHLFTTPHTHTFHSDSALSLSLLARPHHPLF